MNENREEELLKKFSVFGYCKAIKCSALQDQTVIIYLARISFEPKQSIKLYYNCSHDRACKNKECVFKSYLEK